MKQKYSRWQKCQAWKGKSKTTSLNRWYQSLCKEWMQVATLEHKKKNKKNKKIVVVVEHNESKWWSEKRMKKRGALKVMMKMTTFTTKRSIPFV
jgi:hypothetical protein